MFKKAFEPIKNNWAVDKVIASAMEEKHRVRLLNGWHKAVDCALGWAEK